MSEVAAGLPPRDRELGELSFTPRVINPVKVTELIKFIEKAANKKAQVKYASVQAGDVPVTYADILKAKKMLKYNPKTRIEEGINKFTAWYMETSKSGKLF